MTTSNTIKTVLAFAIVASFATLPAQGSLTQETWFYEGAGVVVLKTDFVLQTMTILDNGAVTCKDTNGDGRLNAGVGGMCIPFGALYRDEFGNHVPDPWDPRIPNAIEVKDALHDVVYQICVDVNGDGLCTGESDREGFWLLRPPAWDCDNDLIVYSHGTGFSGPEENRAALFVPEWVEEHWAGCGGASVNGFEGYVVMICGGIHSTRGNTIPAHPHEASHGMARPVHVQDHTTGDFCGAPTATKAYTVVW